MLSGEDYQRLGRLLNNLYLCTGIKFALMDENAREVYTSSFQTPFCRLIAQEPGGYQRCVMCDHEALTDVRTHHIKKKYLCHAGLYELAMPFTENGRTIATILCGQILDDTPRDEQWNRVSNLCSWYPDRDELHHAFLSLKRISSQQMAACMELVQACVSEVRLNGHQGLQGFQSSDWRDDTVLLQNYIDTHYIEPITSDTLCHVLNVGKTKLYALCDEHFHQTPNQLVTSRRVEAAKDLLLTTDQSIRYIAQAVGIYDENYFTKVFRKALGCTPTQFRKNRSVFLAEGRMVT
ncbi:MAG: PocR ligand-binding domain-containing protein [Clostridia bacterium]